MKTNNKFKIGRLYGIAIEYANTDTLINEDEIIKNDLTQDFWDEIEAMIKEQEIIIININAKPRMGKSTTGMAIGHQIHKLMKKHQQIPQNDKFGMKNIARDQQEHNQLMKNPNIKYTVIVTDESNALENTGLNITAEKALESVFSDIQAVRQVHRVCCSPNTIIDNNSDIILQIISKRKQDYTTLAKLYYRIQEKGMETIQLIGHVKVNCAPIVKTWEDKVRKHYYKPKQTKHTKTY